MTTAPSPTTRGGPVAGMRYRRRSRVVGVLKVMLPTVALSLLALVLAWSQLGKLDPGFKLGFSLTHPEEARTLRMVNARYAGLSRGTQPYLVTAASAVQDHPGADLVFLTDPKGDITTRNKAWVAVTAPEGVYRQEEKLLDLSGGVNLFHDSGLEFVTATATIDLDKSAAHGDAPVTGHGPAADIRSQGFRVLDRGKRVIFTGKAKLTLYQVSKTPVAKEGQRLK